MRPGCSTPWASAWYWWFSSARCSECSGSTLLAHVGAQGGPGLISGYMRHILALPMSFFEMRRVGEILSRVHDAGKVREAISGTAATAAVDGALVVLMVAVLWTQDVRLALVATAFVPLLIGGTCCTTRPPSAGPERRWKTRPCSPPT